MFGHEERVARIGEYDNSDVELCVRGGEVGVYETGGLKGL